MTKRPELLPANHKHKWDKQVELDETYKQLVNDLSIGNYANDNQARILCILIIAGRNGSRRHEAVSAYNLFVKNKRVINERNEDKRFVVVDVEKTGWIRTKQGKKERKKDRRRMHIPLFIPSSLGKYDRSEQNIWNFSAYHYHWNPHSLRYAVISKLSETETAQTIAGITGHRTLNIIRDYTNERHANTVLAKFKPA